MCFLLPVQQTVEQSAANAKDRFHLLFCFHNNFWDHCTEGRRSADLQAAVEWCFHRCLFSLGIDYSGWCCEPVTRLCWNVWTCAFWDPEEDECWHLNQCALMWNIQKQLTHTWFIHEKIKNLQEQTHNETHNAALRFSIKKLLISMSICLLAWKFLNFSCTGLPEVIFDWNLKVTLSNAVKIASS